VRQVNATQWVMVAMVFVGILLPSVPSKARKAESAKAKLQ
jgi:hypothetical protein